MGQGIADRRMRLYRRQIQKSHNAILHYNTVIDDLSIWKW
jgi:hypothetical protein